MADQVKCFFTFLLVFHVAFASYESVYSSFENRNQFVKSDNYNEMIDLILIIAITAACIVAVVLLVFFIGICCLCCYKPKVRQGFILITSVREQPTNLLIQPHIPQAVTTEQFRLEPLTPQHPPQCDTQSIQQQCQYSSTENLLPLISNPAKGSAASSDA